MILTFLKVISMIGKQNIDLNFLKKLHIPSLSINL